MLNITTEAVSCEADVEKAAAQRVSLKPCVLEKLRTRVNSFGEAERDEFLGRGRHPPLDQAHDNDRHG